uniref:NADH-ubiquinone oxidoreductase chain 2 n=1 Tax=Apogon quadrisquamatus TaxID=308097 RepID=C7A8X4_9TELE|nr:NADH dehydrogenase subunit 2 [Apogon quadrisquamatus]
MNPWVMFVLIASLGLGTTITFASSHWLLAWMGLEINTLAIIPLMAQHHHPRAVEAATKYFLTQAAAAALVLFATTSNAWLLGEWHIQHLFHPLPATITMIALGMKWGLAPMHLWLPEVLQGLDLTTGLILSTWQKLAPMVLIYQLSAQRRPLDSAFDRVTSPCGGWGGLNQTQLRKILAYSSCRHFGWMMLVLPFSDSICLLTFILYLGMTSTAFFVFKLNASTDICSLAISWAKSPALSAVTPLVLLSLGGLPPLTGFISKWLILAELTKGGLAVIAVVAALSALLALYFYLRLAYVMTLTMTSNSFMGPSPWRIKAWEWPLSVSITTVATIALIPVTPMAFALSML